MASLDKIAILGTGLMGGSLGLALRKNGYTGLVAGWDRSEVLKQAVARGAVEEGFAELAATLQRARLVVLATPVSTILRLLPEVFRLAERGALVTDVGGTKRNICRLARKILPDGALFLGGHPMVGKATGGIGGANAELYQGCRYLLVGDQSMQEEERVREFVSWIERIGARPLWTDEETHDWAVAVVSHLPQLLSTALASLAWDELDDDDLPIRFAGPAFHDLTRLADSPFDIWRDITQTNAENIERLLDRLIQRLDWIKMRLRESALEEEFAKAHELRTRLRALQETLDSQPFPRQEDSR